jgi:hypothetical protein
MYGYTAPPRRAFVIFTLAGAKVGLASPVIWSKYRWVAAYHDYFCKKWRGASGKSLKISKQVLRSDPELLVSKSNGAELA